MPNAPSTMRIQTGDIGSGIAAEAIAANLLVNVNSSEQVALNGADGMADGSAQEAAASGAQATFYKRRPGDRARLKGTGTLVAGDFFKGAASGLIQADGTSGATALSVNTLGVVLAAEGTDGVSTFYWGKYL